MDDGDGGGRSSTSLLLRRWGISAANRVHHLLLLLAELAGLPPLMSLLLLVVLVLDGCTSGCSRGSSSGALSDMAGGILFCNIVPDELVRGVEARREEELDPLPFSAVKNASKCFWDVQTALRALCTAHKTKITIRQQRITGRKETADQQIGRWHPEVCPRLVYAAGALVGDPHVFFLMRTVDDRKVLFAFPSASQHARKSVAVSFVSELNRLSRGLTRNYFLGESFLFFFFAKSEIVCWHHVCM